MRSATPVSTAMTGWNRTLNGLQRAGDAASDRLGAVDRVELGHHLAGDELGAGDDQEGDNRGDRDGGAVREGGSERAFEDVSERGLAERADRRSR